MTQIMMNKVQVIPPSAQLKYGKFITLEGIDGAGKSSHVSAVADWVRQQGHTCIETREPGGTLLGEQLRSVILHQKMSSLTELLLVFAARAEHLAQVITPALARGDWVVCDRFTDSTLAYQGGGRGMDKAVIAQLSHILVANQPDLTLIFDIELQIAADRMQGRGIEDKFEAESQHFARAVQQMYREIAMNNPQRCVLIDGAQTLSTVRNEVLNTLAALLKNNIDNIKNNI